LNDQRISLYSNSSTPLWEVLCGITAWDEVIDMTDDGNRITNGYNSLVEVYEPGSSTPVWSTTISHAIKGIQIQNDGQKVYVAAVNQITQDSAFVYCFNVGQNTPVRVRSFSGYYAVLVVSKSGNRLLLGEYGGGINKMRVLNPVNGSVIFETAFSDQYPPGISDDGKYIISGDYSGQAF
jgi:hypothetical protein